MGTVFTITVFDDEVDHGAVDAAFSWLRYVEATFSTFRDDSEISQIGRGELGPDDASSDVRHVLARCEELEEASEGRFSIRPGRVGGPGLDPAGFVKGWSVDEAAMSLQIDGVTRFMIDAGGDVQCLGTPPDGDRWRVGVRHPQEPDKVGAVLRIREGAVATSGTYFRGEHIWGGGPSLGIADALATAIYGDRASSLAWMSRFPDYGVMLMTSEGLLKWTEPLHGIVDGADASTATDI
jgi:thiamine biosynthesis lipoprotein